MTGPRPVFPARSTSFAPAVMTTVATAMGIVDTFYVSPIADATDFNHHNRRWWAVEARRIDTDWSTILRQHSAAIENALLHMPVTCDTCGWTPCANVSFCHASRIADARLARQRQQWQHLNSRRPAPESTVQAILHCVRERGVRALKEPANIERLRRCDAAAMAKIDARLAKLEGRPK
jgi:hypothetical protein